MQHISIADLTEIGGRFGIHYDFSHPLSASRRTPVLYGQVQEMALASGLHFTNSSLEVLRPYETTSTQSTDLFLLIVLEGLVRLRVAQQEYVLKAGMGLTTSLSECEALSACHQAKQQLRTVTVALDTRATSSKQPASWLASHFNLPVGPATRIWQLPRHLLAILQQLKGHEESHLTQQRLFIEGIALQLVAYALEPEPVLESARVTPQQRLRLQSIREQIDQAPSLDYSIQQLAKQAAMSSSSFRNKFQAEFGLSVFEYLRERRLTLARDYLLQGYSVQQAAHFTGYRHATNFATAFRRYYGVAPSQVGEC